MIKEVFITETNCITPLGFDVATNLQNIVSGRSGIELHQNSSLMEKPFYASIINDDQLNEAFAKVSSAENFTRLEKMMILALQPIVQNSKFQVECSKFKNVEYSILINEF